MILRKSKHFGASVDSYVKEYILVLVQWLVLSIILFINARI